MFWSDPTGLTELIIQSCVLGPVQLHPAPPPCLLSLCARDPQDCHWLAFTQQTRDLYSEPSPNLLAKAFLPDTPFFLLLGRREDVNASKAIVLPSLLSLPYRLCFLQRESHV